MFGKSRGGYIPRDVIERLTGVECDNQDAGIFPGPYQSTAAEGRVLRSERCFEGINYL